MRLLGPLTALVSAALFGASPVLAKRWMGDISPVQLAGLLYFGSGLGLLVPALLSFRKETFGQLRAASRELVGVILFGGILGPIAFAYGLKLGTAFEVSLLLNLESVATTVLAWLVFREHVSKSVWFGKSLIVLGGLVIALVPGYSIGVSGAAPLLLLACVFWGLDNNLTRDLDRLPPALVASLKGLVAGGANLALAAALGEFALFGVPAGSSMGATLSASVVPNSVPVLNLGAILALGAVSYGVSLLLFIVALRMVGASRTGSYFSFGPFIGMVLSVFVLSENPSGAQWLAGTLALLGVIVLAWERHQHSHAHLPMTHTHWHRHDEHHQHSHGTGQVDQEAHSHSHTHAPLTHTHPHWPDIHHRHSHG